MSATIRMNGPHGPLATLENGVWTSEVETLALILNGEMLTWKWERPKIYDPAQDRTDALHMIETFGGGNAELVEFIPESTEGDDPNTVY